MYKAFNQARISKPVSYDNIIKRISDEFKEFTYARDPVDRIMEAGDIILQFAKFIYKLEQATGHSYQTILGAARTKYASRDKIGKDKSVERDVVQKFLRDRE